LTADAVSLRDWDPMTPPSTRSDRQPASVVGAIDCGTNSTRLLVTESTGREITRRMRITRLGQGVDQHHRLQDEALTRTMTVLSEYRTAMDDAGVERVRVVATSAVRDAENGDAFFRQAREVIGVDPEILTGVEEGKLAYSGAMSDLPDSDGDTLVVDIGGGSTELILGRDGTVSEVSLQLGCVRLTERHLRHDPPTEAEIDASRGAISLELARAEQEIPELLALRPQRRLIGLAGTVSTLSALELEAADYSFERLHHSLITAEQIGQRCRQLSRLTSSERAELVGMTAGREDVILGGALVLEVVVSRYGFDHVIVSERDILDGIAASLA
jgi:exopolyphosphatase / guanosine-5'-triphosphate,3'-diphosphate pyrophosphatase